MKILKTEALPEFEYFKVECEKTQIVLHHTVSAMGKYIDDWFKADKGKSRVAVAYVVDKDGTIFELFNPKYWAYHIGKGSSAIHNRMSIGIEIVNEGPLYKRSDGKFFWWIDATYKQGRYPYDFTPVDVGMNWRGFKYFASYTKEQYQAVNELLDYLFKEFNIRRNFSNTFDYNRSFFDYKGVVMHVNLREDKTDLSLAYKIDQLNTFIKGIQVADIPKPITFEQFKQSEWWKEFQTKKITYDV